MVSPAQQRWLQLQIFDRARPFSPLVIRAFLATFLVYMSQDNVFDAARMREFERFLAANDVPAPGLCAPLSVYAQFVGGILIALGALTRWAAAIIVINFVVAIATVHWGTPFRTFLEPTAMLSAALFLVLHGPGPLALDHRFGAAE